MGVQLHAIRTTWVFGYMQSELHGCSVASKQDSVAKPTWIYLVLLV